MKRKLSMLLSLMVIASMILTACATATQTAVVTEEVAPAQPQPEAPTEVPAPTFNGTVTVTFVQEPDNLNPMYTDMYFSLILPRVLPQTLLDF